MLTGEVGGKTTLCRKLLEGSMNTTRRYSTAAESAIVRNATAARHHERARRRSQSTLQNDLLDKINDLLLERIDAGREIVVIIGSAEPVIKNIAPACFQPQDLRPEAAANHPHGATELSAKEERLRQLRQRILVHYDLKPLNSEEVEFYIQHRLTLALVGDCASPGAP